MKSEYESEKNNEWKRTQTADQARHVYLADKDH